MVYGPILHRIDSMDKLNESTSAIWGVINGTAKSVPETNFPGFVDVRDAATAHVAALTAPTASNSRYSVAGGLYSFGQVAAIAKKRHPDRQLAQGDTSLIDSYNIDGSKCKRELLQRDYITFEKCISDTVDQLYELEKQTKRT
jgi:nucleoside-diphosphate-sugar epimerase